MKQRVMSSNAIIYLRVSTKEQAQKGSEAEGYSIPAQRAACTRKAESMGARVIDEFVDAGESAKTSARPRLQAMLTRLTQGDIQYVIVHKVDRLARNRADDVMINLAITKAGARLVSVSESIDETPSGNLVHGIMSDIAEFYSKNLANEVLKGMTEKARRGGTVNMAPVGYVNVAQTIGNNIVKTVEVDPERFNLMRYAFEEYATGRYSLNTLAAILEDRGLTYRPGMGKPERPVGANHLHRLFKNRYYVGKINWLGVEYQGSHTPLVSEELFNKVQEVSHTHARSGERAYRNTHYLKGSLICFGCKERITYAITGNGRGAKYPYFFCLGRRERHANCGFPSIQARLIEKEMDKQYLIEPMNAEEVAQIKKQLLHDLSIYKKKSVGKHARLQARIKKLDADRYAWADKAMEGSVPSDIAREKQASLAGQLTQARKELNDYSIETNTAKRTIEYYCALAEHCGELYRKGDPQLRQIINQTLFDSFEVEVINRKVTVYARHKPVFELLKTAHIERTYNTSLRDIITKEEKRREEHYTVFSLIDDLRVNTLEGPVGLEPTTPCLKGRCSNRLSYGPSMFADQGLLFKIFSNELSAG